MTADEFEDRIQKLIAEARNAGLTRDEMITELEGVLFALKDGA
jgi:hypothetical protein